MRVRDRDRDRQTDRDKTLRNAHRHSTHPDNSDAWLTLVLSLRMLLRECYAACSTELAYAATRVLRGVRTERAYAATRRPGSRRAG
eukprot:100415-Rhodomonas_salina.1